jgi:hypothetical protein
MEALLALTGVVTLAAAAYSQEKKVEPQNPPGEIAIPDQGAYSPPVYLPEGSGGYGDHPGNLPPVQPIYASPETDPERANGWVWQPEHKPTGTFEDAFVETTVDTPETIRNSLQPEGQMPSFKRKDQALRYIPAMDPYEFKPPKSELLTDEATESHYTRQGNVTGNHDYSTMYGKRYAQTSLRENGPAGALDDYTMWDTAAGDCKTKQERDLGIDEESDPGERGWFGARTTTRRYEGEHPRDRIFPRKEGFVSLRQQVFSRPGIPYAAVSGNYNPSLGRYEMPDNEDTTNYMREPMPELHRGPGVPARIENVPIRRTERTTVQYPYAGVPSDTLRGEDAGRTIPVYARETLGELLTESAARTNNGALGVDTIADCGGSGRVNNNEPRETLKDYVTVTAGAAGYWNQRNAEHQAVQYQPDFPGAEVRRVTPDIEMDINPDLIQAYRSNPYAPPITNMPGSFGEISADCKSDINKSMYMPAYAGLAS